MPILVNQSANASLVPYHGRGKSSSSWTERAKSIHGYARSRSTRGVPDSQLSVLSDFDLLSQELNEAGGNALPNFSGPGPSNLPFSEECVSALESSELVSSLIQPWTYRTACWRETLEYCYWAVQSKILALSEMASEANQTLTQEVSAQRFRATESFEFLEKAARDQITRLRAERDLEINEARKAIASVDEAKGLEVALLRDQLSRQCQDTENLKQELRRPSELQEEIIAELMSLGAQRGNPRGTFPYAWIAKPTRRSGQVLQGSTFLHRMVPQNVTTLKKVQRFCTIYECFQKWRIQNLWSHACCISANHTPNHAPESYPRIIPRIIPMILEREGETYPETYPRNIPPKHTSNHTPWCNTLCWARSFRKGPYRFRFPKDSYNGSTLKMLQVPQGSTFWFFRLPKKVSTPSFQTMVPQANST